MQKNYKKFREYLENAIVSLEFVDSNLESLEEGYDEEEIKNDILKNLTYVKSLVEKMIKEINES